MPPPLLPPFVTGPATRNDPPILTDWAMVVRVIGPIVGGLGPVDQGLPNVFANAWPMVIVDPTTGLQIGVLDAVAVAALQRGIIAAGRDDFGLSRFINIDSRGAVRLQNASSSVVSSVPAAVVTTLLLAANPSRKMAIVHNDSAGRFLYLKLGLGALTTDFTVRLGPQSYFELPIPVYDGPLTGIWSAGAPSFARVTELT